MSAAELKAYIDKVLGNSIRCLLPSYWWKRLLNLIVDKVSDVEAIANKTLAELSTGLSKIIPCYVLYANPTALQEAYNITAMKDIRDAIIDGKNFTTILVLSESDVCIPTIVSSEYFDIYVEYAWDGVNYMLRFHNNEIIKQTVGNGHIVCLYDDNNAWPEAMLARNRNAYQHIYKMYDSYPVIVSVANNINGFKYPAIGCQVQDDLKTGEKYIVLNVYHEDEGCICVYRLYSNGHMTLSRIDQYDSEMSLYSNRAVQNRVIKEYIDNEIAKVKALIK